jgi:predicted adenine nucleotide alpha hydrolase (AANH) superfamily ATPase
MKDRAKPADVRIETPDGDGIAQTLSETRETEKRKPGLLVHSCCGPCSTAVMERLSAAYDVTLFFFNPNITDEEEYERRLHAQQLAVEKYNASGYAPGRVTLVVGAYEPKLFLAKVRGLEREPEGGARCAKCFEMRLEKTAEYASLYGFDRFTTTLSVSPHKDHLLLVKIGTGLALRYGLAFLAEDFKKQAGFQRAAELSKAYGLYRQNYCGCVFSRREPVGGET